MIGLRLPKILFIKGVFKKDCQEYDFVEKKVIANTESEIAVNQLSENVINNDLSFLPDKSCGKLPCNFESLDQWPKRTHLLCWHCSLQFNSMPIFIPKVIEPIISKNKHNQYSIGVFGVFCSFGDAMEFIKNSNWVLTDKIEASNKLRHLYKLFFGTQLKETNSYPYVYDMIQYGGNMEVSEYKKQVESFKTQKEIEFLEKL